MSGWKSWLGAAVLVVVPPACSRDETASETTDTPPSPANAEGVEELSPSCKEAADAIVAFRSAQQELDSDPTLPDLLEGLADDLGESEAGAAIRLVAQSMEELSNEQVGNVTHAIAVMRFRRSAADLGAICLEAADGQATAEFISLWLRAV